MTEREKAVKELAELFMSADGIAMALASLTVDITDLTVDITEMKADHPVFLKTLGAICGRLGISRKQLEPLLRGKP